MAVITRPRETAVPFGTPLSSPTTATRTLVQAGIQQQEFGRQIEAQGNQFLELANASLETALLTNAMSDATNEINTRVQQRFDDKLNEDGTPNFNTLVSDVNQITQESKNKFSGPLINPRLRAQYEQRMARFVGNKQLSALNEARRQQINFTRESVFSGVEALKEQALADDFANVETYSEQIRDIIQDSVDSGAMNPVEAAQLAKRSESQMRLGHWQNQIDQAPELAAAALESIEDPMDIGLTNNEFRKIKKISQSALNDKQAAMSKQRREAQDLVKRTQNLTEAELELGIIKSTLGEQDIEKAFSDEQVLEIPGQKPIAYTAINEMQRINLLQKLARQENSSARKTKLHQDVMTQVNNNELLSGFTKKQISDAYEKEVNAVIQQGQKLPLTEKAQIAARFRGPVDSIQTDIEFAVTAGEIPIAVDAVRAYDYLSATNPFVLDGMDKKNRAVASMASEFIRSTNMSDAEAFRRARESILDVDDSDRQLRTAEFRRIDDFKTDNIKNTIIDMHDEGIFDFTDIDPAPGVTTTFQRLLREAYIDTGDKKAAKRFVKDVTKNKYGESDLGDGRFMLMPPEKIFDIGTKELREDIVLSLAQKNIKVDEDNIFIESDILTISPNGQVSYGLFTKGPNDERIPLLNPTTLSAERWIPEIDKINQRRLRKGTQEALELRQSIINQPTEQITRFGQLPIEIEEEEKEVRRQIDIPFVRFGIGGEE